MAGIGEGNQKKRKLQEGAEIEIDVSAPEPPSKKALRKAKKQATRKELNGDSKPEEEEPVESPAAPQKRSDYGIWIGNLSFSVTKDEVRRFFTSNCSFTEATITRIHMPKSTEKHGKAQNKGFAYVDFANAKAAQEAVGLSEQLLTGRRVLIKDSQNFSGRPEKSQQEEGQNAGSAATSSGRPPSKRIFVGNLGFDTTKDIIEEHFAKCGTVVNVHVATFQDTGKCKGYAWVEFEDIAAAEAAVRGFKMVNEDDEEEDVDGSDAESGKRKKPRQKKIWVNQLLGRRMRMEFAEDATTRYKKRFGKDGESKKNDTPEISEVQSGSSEQQSTEEKHNRARHAKPKPAKPDYSRYGTETVQKLSGAIVESQGKKTTFD